MGVRAIALKFIKKESKMEALKEYLPFLLPLIFVQFALFGYTLWHILKHNEYKRWSKRVWLVIVIVGMNFVGPICYFIFGKKD